MRTIKSLCAVIALFALSISLSGCSGFDGEAKKDDPSDQKMEAQKGDDKPNSSVEGGGTSDSSSADSPTVYTAPKVTGDSGQEPTIEAGKGNPPSELHVDVLKQGNGKTIQESDTVTVHYKGQLWNGEVFDSSWSRGEPATFPLSGVIPGWTKGLAGHKVGDRLLLTIPPDLAYGAQGSPPAIPPNATLVFVVDLLQ